MQGHKEHVAPFPLVLSAPYPTTALLRVPRIDQALPSPLSPQGTMLQAIERYMKQAIVDKVPSVSSSALVSSLVCSCCRDAVWLGLGGGLGN